MARATESTHPRGIHELEGAERRRLIARSAVVSVVSVAAVVVAYFVVPLAERDGASVGTRLVIAIAVLVVAVAVSLSHVMRADFPVLRAAESLAGVVSLAIVAFASAYVLVSSSDSAAFSEPLDQVDALYFSLTTATTVGFGDIHAVSNVARVVVMIQMVTNVVVVGVAARVLFNTARRRIEH